LALGLPICFVLGGTAAIFAIFAWGPESLYVIILSASNTMSATILVAAPLFIFMAYMLEEAGIADELYEVMHKWMGSLRGGLSAGTVIGCTIVAAMSGISTSGVILMGIIGLPSMLQRKYDKRLAMGSIMAGGALGPLIPPSLVLIVYALVSGESVGKLFLGGVLPGLVLSILFICYILIRCYLNPSLGPALVPEDRASWKEKFKVLKGIIIPVFLVIAVLGSIFFGVATPTEAAAIGGFGAIISSVINRKINLEVLKSVTLRSLSTLSMVMWVIFAAGCFASIYQGLGVATLIEDIFRSGSLSGWHALFFIQLTWFILGCLMDSLSILMITAPIFLPLVTFFNFDPLWFGILFAVNTEMCFLTPPFGINLIVMKGIVPDFISMGDIFQAALPFVVMQAIGLVLVIIFPSLATYLPSLVF
jgi:tripartite ATP-independent transporter DctM subunit